MRENELELSRFGEYLLKSRIISGKSARCHVGWVRSISQSVMSSTSPSGMSGGLSTVLANSTVFPLSDES